MHDRCDGLKIGMRVRLSVIGLMRSPKTDTHTGVIVGMRSSTSIRVLLDGRRVPLAVHKSYVEPE
ncbi:MAG: hypothetical protein JWR80_1282 [Bradyrhizobium sp.]|nr:hypothetical protein [Bradyrhizobium sp.]